MPKHEIHYTGSELNVERWIRQVQKLIPRVATVEISPLPFYSSSKIFIAEISLTTSELAIIKLCSPELLDNREFTYGK